MAPEGDIGLSDTPKTQLGDTYMHRSQIQCKVREAKQQYLQHQNQQSLQENIQNKNLAYDIDKT